MSKGELHFTSRQRFESETKEIGGKVKSQNKVIQSIDTRGPHSSLRPNKLSWFRCVEVKNM